MLLKSVSENGTWKIKVSQSWEEVAGSRKMERRLEEKLRISQKDKKQRLGRNVHKGRRRGRAQDSWPRGMCGPVSGA
ncbi:hypothetical protein UPYG_G00008990 [Umbra pygmaea]|uniref:Uncharacterized protein n=1 Tax=Umbra pygmaea TaxID=75934 RepID=A0ABD0XI36_UMBPY